MSENKKEEEENTLAEILFTDDFMPSDSFFESHKEENNKKRTKIDMFEWDQNPSVITAQNFTGKDTLLVDIPTSKEGFFDLFFQHDIIDYILKLTNKKIVAKSQAKKKKTSNINSACNLDDTQSLEQSALLSSADIGACQSASETFDRPNDSSYNLVTIEDLYTYLAILLILGINKVANVQFCWNKKKPFSYNSRIASLMKFERFQFINSCLTCISSKDIEGLKLKKCPKIIKGLETLFKTIYIPGEYISIDEGMMAYKGKMKNRVYCPIKPDKWGMKFYILAESTTGFVFNLRIVGEQSTINDTVLSLCSSVMGDYRRLFMDNFYNSYKLVCLLSDHKIYTVGTLRHKRGGPADLLTLKKKVTLEAPIILEKNKTRILIWQDRKPVVIITNCYNVKEELSIPKKTKTIPYVINEYNKYMGGVDKFDQMIKYYPLKRKTNRWTQKFTVHIFEILLHNSHVLYKKYSLETPVSHYDYVESIIKYLLVKGQTASKEKKATQDHTRKLHLPLKSEKRSNCYNCYKMHKLRSTTFMKCEKCDVFLCISPCFYSYHIHTGLKDEETDSN